MKLIRRLNLNQLVDESTGVCYYAYSYWSLVASYKGNKEGKIIGAVTNHNRLLIVHIFYGMNINNDTV